MSGSIDYRNNAQERVRMAIETPQTEHEVPALVLAQIATAEATLALVEQQRVANLISALGLSPAQLADETIKTDAAEVTRARISLRNAIRAEIREALGL